MSSLPLPSFHSQTYRDQTGETISLSRGISRIVSLVPSQTELLYDLGLSEKIVGVTRFCVHPSHAITEKAIVGGTKNFDVSLIDSLVPDLVIGNKEENHREGIEELRRRYPVWLSDVVTLEDALRMIASVGDITGSPSKAREMIVKIQAEFDSMFRNSAKSVLYLIWRKPWMGVATGTFIHDMIGKLGLRNSLTEHARYPQLTDADIRDLDPDLIMLPSEPFPFRESHEDEIRRISPRATVMRVDGEMFSWYGSRLLKAPAYFNSLKFD